MAYTISYVTPAAAFSATKERAGEALEIAMDYVSRGYKGVKLEDGNKGVTYGEREIRKGTRNSAHPRS